MNANRLLALYEKVAEAPDAVPRLRRFVLDLAVRGKLVAQDTGDEPALRLLTTIVGERNARVKRREIKRAAPLEPVEGTPFEAPAGWEWIPLGDTGNIFSGNSINATTREQLEKTDEGFPFIATKDVGYGLDAIDFDNGLLVPASDSRFKVARANSVLICAEGGSAGRKIGLSNREICFGNKLLANETWSVIVPEFVRFVYMSDFFYGEFAARMTGVIGGISIKKFLQVPFPLPPLAEQRRIVAKVEELMALLDRLEAARTTREATRDRLSAASLARLTAPDADPADFPANARFALATLPALTTRPDQIKPLRQTILNLAVRGKLVEQDSTDEPASELLKQIGEAKGAAKGRKGARAKGVPAATESTDTEVPLGWEPVRLEEVAVSMRYGTSIKCDYDEKHAPVLRIPNVSSGQITLDDMKYGPLSEADREALSLEADDLLMIRSNGSLEIVGRPAVVPPEAAGMAFAGYLVRLQTLKEAINSRYVWLALNSSAVRDQIERPIRSAVGLKNVNLTEFGNLSFWLPPIAEQHRIVAKVDALMALCDRLEAALTTADTTRARLLEALLAKALNPATMQEMEAAE
jgi:type I restriction enzyme, S subunit